MKLSSRKGISTKGTKVNVFSPELCTRIRKRLNLTKKQLPDKLIRDVLRDCNSLISEFILENQDGYRLQIGYDSKKPMGVLVVSKHLPKEFRDDNGQILENIDKLEVDESFKERLRKRYDVEIDRVINYKTLMELKAKIPHLNLHSFFYRYKFMWFNKRNTVSKKALCYRFQATRQNNAKLHNQIIEGKDYYEWAFSDFYLPKLAKAKE